MRHVWRMRHRLATPALLYQVSQKNEPFLGDYNLKIIEILLQGNPSIFLTLLGTI